MADPQTDLDAFLTSIESKLRAPFSSLDLAKAISTPTLRGSLSEEEYLHRIAQVISRTDKITQTQLIIALLGLDPSEETDEQIKKILEQTQEAPFHEEWVRIVSCLVQGIMFDDEDGNPFCGQEAKKLLKKTGTDIINRVKRVDYETGGMTEETSRLALADADPLFAPFRYALLNKDILEKVIPETYSNPHFQVNEKSEILSMDAKFEAQKATEDMEHSSMAGRPKQSTATNSTTVVATETPAPFLPGLRKGVVEKTASAKERPKASLFMPSKKPIAAAKGIKPSLHSRKAGAAQALLAKGKRRMQANIATTSNAPSAASGVRGRAVNKLSNNRSKMKVLDVSEVQEINKDLKEREEEEHKKTSGNKRKNEGVSATAKAVKLRKAHSNGAKPSLLPAEEKVIPPPLIEKSSEAGALDLASMALSAYQAQVGAVTASNAQYENDNDDDEDDDPMNGHTGLAAASSTTQQHWQQLLQETSNRLSTEDRSRIEQFFVNRFNPTPDQPIYKMKLHEQRSHDPKTGVPVKETFYLELDYTTFTSKQSKKTKRYS